MSSGSLRPLGPSVSSGSVSGAGPGGVSADVALLQQVEVGLDAEFFEGAGDPGGAQVAGPLVDVLPGRQDLVGGEFAGGHPGVAGGFPERADVGVLAGLVLAPQRRLRVQLQDQPVGVGAELPERLGLGRRGELLIGLGQVLGGQVRGLVFGDAQVDGVDLPGPQRRERDRQPGRDGARVDDLAFGGLPGHAHQVRGERIGRELADLRGAGQARDRRVGITRHPARGHGRGRHGGATGTGVASGAGAGRRVPGRVANSRIAVSSAHAANDPIRRTAAITPDQVIVGQGGQDLLIGGRGVDQGGQDRAGDQLLRGAVLAEPGPGDVLRRSVPHPRPRRPSAPPGRPRCRPHRPRAAGTRRPREAPGRRRSRPPEPAATQTQTQTQTQTRTQTQTQTQTQTTEPEPDRGRGARGRPGRGRGAGPGA